MELVQEFGWKKPENLEDLFYLLQEQAVIDSDLVDRMIAMFRLRWDLIEDNLEKGDYKLVDDIIRLNFEDIHLFLEQVGEFIPENAIATKTRRHKEKINKKLRQHI